MPQRKNVLNEDGERIRAQNALNAHDASLRAQGFDPQYIGITEVNPVKCCGCGAPIPWAVLKGYAS
jgi:hypothetical protein